MNSPWFKSYEHQISWLEFNQNLQIDLINKYVYFEMPKAACSTIKARLQNVITRGLPAPDKVHPTIYASPFVKPFQLPSHLMRKILAGEQGFTRFTFIREPEARIVSAYLDKICRPTEQRKRFIKKFLPEADPENEIVSLDTFISVLDDLEGSHKMDKHWRPQVDLIFQPHQELDFIGRLDRFEADWAVIMDKVGLSSVEDGTDIRWHATSANQRSSELVTDLIRKKIHSVYGRDFELYESLS